MARASSDVFYRLVPTEPQSNLNAWLDASNSLSDPNEISRFARAFLWARLASELTYESRSVWRERVVAEGLVRHQSPELLEHISMLMKEDASDDFIAEVFWREQALTELTTSDSDHLANQLISDTQTLVAALSCLRDTRLCPHTAALLDRFPELEAIRYHRADHVTSEHEKSSSSKTMPLLEHIVDRVLGRKLRGLELADIHIFQRDESLSEAAFNAEVALLTSIREAGLLPALRATLMFLDFSKGGSDVLRATWISQGIDLSIHNEASAQILEQHQVLRRFPRFRASEILEALIVELVRVHGLTGQAIRGECSLMVFEPFLTWLRDAAPQLSVALAVQESEAIDAAIDMLHLVNLCDTAGVREGLYTDGLRIEFMSLEMLLRRVARSDGEILQELKHHEGFEPDDGDGLMGQRQLVWLTHRISCLRKGRIQAGEPLSLTQAAVAALPPNVLSQMTRLLATCQLWYVEVATSALTPEAQVRLLYCSLVAADRDGGLPPGTLKHLTFLPLVRELDRQEQPAARYRVRLIEALLRRLDISQIAAGAEAFPDDVLGSFQVELGGTKAHGVRFEASAEAQALLTLLPAYERKSSAAFHATLKTLCDLYGLRKDEFDRMSNEVDYLAHMNAARADKERMLDYVIPGRIVEVGPGGGVILDLLEARFHGSDIVGVDLSQMVVEALQHRKQTENRKWTVIEADAFELERHLEPGCVSTIILCSVLHEIYSYVERDVDGTTKRFRLESVRDLLRSCYKTLQPGGRIIIRDGITPRDEPRIIEFIDSDGPQFFRLFQEQFEGRPIRGEWLDDKRVRLGAADAMEFLYCYTWGPSSFPYEVREQYGVLPYEEYARTIVAWLADKNHPPRVVPIPPADASYLQQGYVDGLADKVRLYDGGFQSVALPDSNALLVFEKT